MQFLSNLIETVWLVVTLPLIIIYCFGYSAVVAAVLAAGNIVDVWTNKG